MEKEIVKLLQKYPLANFSMIHSNSKLLTPGSIFVACIGDNSDGNEYIPEAISRGAKLIVSDQPETKTKYSFLNEGNFVLVKDSYDTLIQLVSLFYLDLPDYIAAVTGTNGKTSVANYTAQFLNLLNLPAASIGTLGLKPNYDIEYNQTLTTPDIVSLYTTLSELKRKGINYIALEASSHGLNQKRLGKIQLKTAAFTSFSLDHQDYHKDLDDYLANKMKLFNYLNHDRHIIINKDMNVYPKIVAELKGHIIVVNRINEKHKLPVTTFSKNKEQEINALSWDILNNNINNQEVCFYYKNKSYQFATSIVPEFQVSNLLISMMMVHMMTSIDLLDLTKIVPMIYPVVGRLQRVTDLKAPYSVFVDYCHTPEALEYVLKAMRYYISKSTKISLGRLILIIGCGGNRDKSKRPIMGQIASEYADLVIITDDNPRYEKASQIRSEILASCKNGIEMDDRQQAIAYAIKLLKKNDILIIGGKGHEDYQLIAGNKIPFNDVEVAKKYLQEL